MLLGEIRGEAKGAGGGREREKWGREGGKGVERDRASGENEKDREKSRNRGTR